MNTPTSNRLQSLTPATQQLAEQVLSRAAETDFGLLIYCTRRALDDQARLYRQGRSYADITNKARELDKQWGRADLAELLLGVGPQRGGVVTWAGPGQSLHNYGLAFDAVPLRAGKAVWATRLPDDRAAWEHYGKLVTEAGLEWAGNWSGKKREFPHAQQPGINWQDLIRL